MLGTHPQYHPVDPQIERDLLSTPRQDVDFGPLPVSNLKTKKSSVAFDILPESSSVSSPPIASRKYASGLLPRRFTEPNLPALAHSSAAHDDAMTRLAALQDRMHDHLHHHTDAQVRAVMDLRHARVTALAAKLDADHQAALERAAKKRQEKVEKLHKHNEEVDRHKRKHECAECLRRQASIQYSSFVRHMSDDVAMHQMHMAAGARSHLHRHATHSGLVTPGHVAVESRSPPSSSTAAAPVDQRVVLTSSLASYGQLRRSYSYAPGMSMAPPLAPLATRAAAAASDHHPAGSTSSPETTSPIEVMNPPMYEVRRSVMMMATVSTSPTSGVEALMVPPEYCRRSSSAASIPGCAPLEMG